MRAIGNGAGFEQLQSTFQCGASCGSCVPELRRMVQIGAGAATGTMTTATATGTAAAGTYATHKESA